MSFVAAPSEEVMTWRARAYLSIGACRHLAIGASCLLVGQTFQSEAFAQIKAVFPIWLWGVVFVLGGLHMGYAAASASETAARVAMTFSAVVTSVWAAGFIMAFEPSGGVVSPVGGILFTALTLKDLVVCRQPMRSPFEPIVKEYAEHTGPVRIG